MKIIEQLKPALISHWMEKAFKANYPQVNYKACADAPNTWQDLRYYSWYLKEATVYNKITIPVFDGNCENTIYNKPTDNHMFRAWHDCVHLQHNLSFKPIDERKVGMIQCEQLRAIGAPVHVINAVYFDVIGQIEYYSKHGDFVKDQRAFVQDCLVIGLDQAINLAYDTATQAA